MANTLCTARSETASCPTVNVGDMERILSAAAGGFVLVQGLSRLPLSTLVATLVGGGLIYRGLTGYCDLYQAIGMSTTCDAANKRLGNGTPSRRPPVTDASLAATGEAPAV